MKTPEGGEVFNYCTVNKAGEYAHAEGSETTASGNASHAEGVYTIASNSQAHAEGFQTEASGEKAHAEGHQSRATGSYSHAEGYKSDAEGNASHAEGFDTTSGGQGSHSEGYQTTALGTGSHAGGITSKAFAHSSFAHGKGVIVGSESNKYFGEAQAVFGKYNKIDHDKLFIIGNGSDDSHRANVFTIDKSGRIVVGEPSANSHAATKKYVDDSVNVVANSALKAEAIAYGKNRAIVFENVEAMNYWTERQILTEQPPIYISSGDEILVYSFDSQEEIFLDTKPTCYVTTSEGEEYELDMFNGPAFFKNRFGLRFNVFGNLVGKTLVSARVTGITIDINGKNPLFRVAPFSYNFYSMSHSGMLSPYNIPLGTNFYIVDTSVPDYWWDGFEAQELETQKVDLNDYATKEWVEDKGYLTTHQDISHKLDKTEFTEFTDKFIGDADNQLASPITTEIQVPVQGNTTDNGTDTLYHAMSAMNEQLLELREKVGTDSIRIGDTEFTEEQLIKILNFIDKIEMTGGTN